MSDHIAEREKLLTEPIVSDILRAVAEDIGVTPEEYIDRFIEVFTEQPEKMPFSENKKDEAYLRFREAQLKVINRLIERGYTSFISGAAQGFDTWVAEDILALRKKNKELSLECAIPFPDQAKKWPLSEQIRRHNIISHADSSVTLSEHYHRDCFFARNRYMVDKADVVVCAYDGQSGGTAYTVDYALKHDKIVIQINPTTAKVTIISKRTFED